MRKAFDGNSACPGVRFEGRTGAAHFGIILQVPGLTPLHGHHLNLNHPWYRDVPSSKHLAAKYCEITYKWRFSCGNR